MSNLVCIICLELLEQSSEVYITPCGHLFHYACILQWLERSTTCPQCRKSCSSEELIRVYFNIGDSDAENFDVGLLRKHLDDALNDVDCLKKQLDEVLGKVEALQKKLSDERTSMAIEANIEVVWDCPPYQSI